MAVRVQGSHLAVDYYYTDIKKADDAVTDDELTPLVMENGRLVGWGWSFLDQNVERYRIEIRNR